MYIFHFFAIHIYINQTKLNHFVPEIYSISGMYDKDQLRIRTPPYISEDLSTKTETAEIYIRHSIPTYILIITFANLALYIYNGNSVHMYFAIVTGVIWLMAFLQVVYEDRYNPNLLPKSNEVDDDECIVTVQISPSYSSFDRK